MDGADAAVDQTASVPVLTIEPLRGDHVWLEPVRIDHVDAISAAAGGDRSTYGYTQVPDGRAETMDYVSMLLAAAADGSMGPFVQRRCGDDRVVGCTRYMSPAWPIGRTDPDEIEIGGTWLSADAQRTPINTEAKLLLLGYAFGTWNVQRVAICTDARNDRSRRAIERLGATFEGVMRRHRRSTHAGDGDRLRDTACYAITIDDWPTVQAALVARLNGHR